MCKLVKTRENSNLFSNHLRCAIDVALKIERVIETSYPRSMGARSSRASPTHEMVSARAVETVVVPIVRFITIRPGHTNNVAIDYRLRRHDLHMPKLTLLNS